MKSSLLSTAAHHLLEKMAPAGIELTYAKGGGWWLENHHTHGRIVKELLRLCLISQTYGQVAVYEVYEINEEGRAILKDPSYQPQILSVAPWLRATSRFR